MLNLCLNTGKNAVANIIKKIYNCFVAIWNPWHGCVKKSEGCLNCYVYRRDSKYDLDASSVYKTKQFDYPIKRNKKGLYVLPPGEFVWTCFTSDFLLDKADEWRKDAWRFIKERNDCHFLFITKRIERFFVNLKERLPLLKAAPIKHKFLVCEPLLDSIDLHGKLDFDLQFVVVGGESGLSARPVDYRWIIDIRDACIKQNIGFKFKQTGYRFVKEGKTYLIPRKFQHSQAKKANIDYIKKGENYETD